MTETPQHDGGECRQNTQDALEGQNREAPEAQEPNAPDLLDEALQDLVDEDGEMLSERELEARIEALLPDEAEDAPEADAHDSASEETKESTTSEDGENSQPESDAKADGESSWDEPEDGLWAPDAPAASAAPTKTQAERDAEDKKLRAESYKIMANMGNFALYLVIALVFTWFIGSAMDNFFGTTPIFTIFWIFCGIASTVLEVRKTLIAAKKLGESEQK